MDEDMNKEIYNVVNNKKEFKYISSVMEHMGFDKSGYNTVVDYMLDTYIVMRKNKVPKLDSKMLAINDTIDELVRQYKE